jgi:Tfp pilus assembly protein PilX
MKFIKNLKLKIRNLKSDQDGIALLISLLLTGILISIVLTMSIIFLPKIRLAGDVKKSSTAFYAAESAVEWCIYINIKGGAPPAIPVMTNGSTFVNALTDVSPIPADCAATSFKMTGNYQGISRSLEISGL